MICYNHEYDYWLQTELDDRMPCYHLIVTITLSCDSKISFEKELLIVIFTIKIHGEISVKFISKQWLETKPQQFYKTSLLNRLL